MASYYIHLAVGMEYIKRNKINNKCDLLNGTIDPDLCVDKNITHYSVLLPSSNLKEHFNSKVNLVNFLKDNSLDNDYMKGYFLHLITDYIFFVYYLDHEYIKNRGIKMYAKDLYYSYDCTNDYLINKYKIDCKEMIKKIDNNLKKYPKNDNDKVELNNIIDVHKLDKMIKEIGKIDLIKYRQKLMKKGQNILP